ncbi:MAG: ABC transporter ATP-binding protein [Longimicrobiales bacterium]
MAEAVAQTHEEEALGKAYDARLMRRLLRYLRPHRPRVASAIAVLLVGAGVELIGPLLTKRALDQAIPAGDTHLLALLSIAFLATLVAAFIFEATQTLMTTWLGQRVMFDLRREIFTHLQRLPLSYFDRNPVGRLMTRVTSDVEVLNELFSAGVVTVFGDVFTLVLIAIIMFAMDWRLALVSMAVMPLVLATAVFFRRKFRESFRDIRVRLARINAFLQERISGMAVVQLFGRESATLERFHEINDDYLEAHLRSISYYAMFFPIIEVLTAVSLALILAYGGVHVTTGELSVGAITAFLMYARRFFRPIQDLSEKYNMVQGAMASAERIFSLLDTPIGDAESSVAHDEWPKRGRIEFRNVWFAYRARDDHGGDDGDTAWDWVLRDISFIAEPGERVAVVGHTGAGKTTLISLLMRFYSPQRGEILLDDRPLDSYDLHALRRSVGLVLQDVFLFSRSIAYNIRLGTNDISDARVHDAAERVGADAFIARLPGGYDEVLGERGASLSTGERQLLSFARALAFDPLVLVLDEATSSVDSQLEERIEHALLALMAGRTAIVIAHRLSTIQGADRILVFHHGQLAEQGSHAQLLSAQGLYASLYELQFAAGNRPSGTGLLSPSAKV